MKFFFAYCSPNNTRRTPVQGNYQLKHYYSPSVSESRGQGCGLNLYDTQPCVQFDKTACPMLSLGNAENGSETDHKSWPEDETVGLVSYDDIIDLSKHEVKECGNLLSMNLKTGQIFCVKFDNSVRSDLLEKDKINSKYGVELQARPDDDQCRETIVAREELVELFEKRAEASWIAESMFIAPIMYSCDPLRRQYIHDQHNPEAIAEVVHPALIIVSQGIDSKYYPFAIPMSARDDVGTLDRNQQKGTSECIPLHFKAAHGNFVKYNKRIKKVCIVEHNLCPKLATAVSPDLVAESYHNTQDWEVKYEYWGKNTLTWHSHRPVAVSMAAQLDKIQTGGPLPDSLKIRMNVNTDFAPMLLQDDLKHSIKQILIKTISFHIRHNTILTDYHVGGFKSIYDLNGMSLDEFREQERWWQEKQEFARQYQKNERLIDELDI